ncbi:alpha-L-fucosidase [Halobacteria archaeon AArc-m2/3/4]|uniref:alpha-L-fucosidase n=1 Tax=Natronoglomus mannanivorans TaxID=2979990 RepID=A0ABT2QKR3_9EURY|nr:alpha-L-fucosidase [Halobacteria archaeon AArc-m2/3/4]
MSYAPTWESLDEHEAPQWFDEAKFGLFVHYSPSAYVADDTDYEPDELPELSGFAADEWADLALDAGAKYLVYTAAHRGGFCSYPSRVTEYSAREVGGPYDVVTPLADAVRSRGVKLGLYFNWNAHPPDTTDDSTWKSGPEEYKLDQAKELVELYDPDIFWADSGWYPSAELQSTEFLAWYYNRAAARGRDVCANDRFGTETRHEWVSTRYEWFRRADTADHPDGRYPDFWYDSDRLLDAAGDETGRGDFFTGEHQVMRDVVDHKWETCLPLSRQWLWKRGGERKSISDLIRLLIDVVSKNGNLLLNVSPKPDGAIDEHDRYVAEGIGDWLAVNGEAIYGTRPFERPREDAVLLPDIDWEEWPRDDWVRLCDHLAEEGPLWYTRTGNVAYALHHGWPGDSAFLEGLSVRDGASVRMLGVDEDLEWTAEDGCVRVATPDERPCEHAYAFRVPMPMGDGMGGV